MNYAAEDLVNMVKTPFIAKVSEGTKCKGYFNGRSRETLQRKELGVCLRTRNKINVKRHLAATLPLTNPL